MIAVEGLTNYYGNVSAFRDVTFFISASGQTKCPNRR
jgi:hypothetical protein